MDVAAWFWREMPGRWRVLSSGGPWADRIPAEHVELARALRLRLSPVPVSGGLEGIELYAVCEVCEKVLACDGDDWWIASRAAVGWEWHRHGIVASWSEFEETVGDHRHDDDVPDGQVRYYTLHPVGPWKTEHIGGWVDVLAAGPQFFLEAGTPVPPVGVLNEYLASGGSDQGMSGGCEFPAHQLTDADFASLRPALLDRVPGLVDFAPPEEITGRDEFSQWWSSYLDGFSPAARESFGRELLELHRRSYDRGLDHETRRAAQARRIHFQSRIVQYLESYDS